MSVVSFPDAGGDLLTLLQVDGELYPYNGDVGQANEIRASANAKARPDDIILCNYPKSVDWGSFYDYVHSWEKTIHDNPTHPIHVVYYEDMKADSAAEVRRLAHFMGVSLSEDLIEAIAEKCSFQNMVKDKMGLEDEKWRKVWRNEKPRMYRKGEVGDWKNWFTVAQNEEFDRIYAERMANSKLKFRFTL